MRDGWAAILAVVVAGGALRPSALPLLAVGALVLAGLVLRHPPLLCLGAALLASALAQRSLDGLEGVRSEVIEGSVTLLTDPEPGGGGLRAEVRLGRRHLELRVSSHLADDLADRLAGDHLVVRGEVAPLSAPSPWQRSRHLAGRLTVLRWSPGTAPAPLPAAANRIRRSLERGAAGLPDREAALLAGLVVGDDRAQPPDLLDDLEGAGLRHLSAVSGQNVAFVLALLGPLARRLRLWPRLAATLAAIGSFALLTRFEPSVSRAAAMAALAATTVTIGQPISRLRALSLGVAALLLVDPLLVGSLGFQLSTAAALAIVVAAEPLARALPGPRWLAEPMAVTAAAQLGVAPLLLGSFGRVPLASVPANLLAVPAAGLVMVWGMTAGILAGALPPDAAWVLHAPTRALLWWIEEVAARGARAPLGTVGATGLVAVAAGLGLLVLAGRAGWPRLRTVAAVAVGGSLYVAVVAAQAPPPLRDVLGAGVVRWHADGTEVVALGGGGWQQSLGPEAALRALREAGVGSIDLLVAVDARVSAAVVETVVARHPAAAVLVPSSVPVTDRPARAVALPPAGTALRVGGLDVLITPGEQRLVVEAWPAPR